MGHAQDDRRTHDRQPLTLPIVLDVEIHGFDGTERPFRASGETVNLGCGGLMANLDRPVVPGVRCLTHFPRGAGKIGRTMIYGTVSRSDPSGSRHEVAVVFDTPLRQVEMPTSTAP